MVLDIVATRDIAPDEEVFIDYGVEWENAWFKHAANWKNPCNSKTKSSMEVKWMNHESRRFDPENFPWTDETMSVCRNANGQRIHIVDKMSQTTSTNSHGNLVTHQFSDIDYNHIGFNYTKPNGSRMPCRILSANREKKTFDAVFFTEEESKADGLEDAKVLIRVPELAASNVEYVHRPFKSDMHLKSAFRHAIKIPDDVFPPQWKDLLNQK